MITTTTRTTLRIFDKAEYLVQSIRAHMAAVSLKLSLTFGELPPRGEEDPPRPDWAQVQRANLELLEQRLVEAHLADQLYRDAKVTVSEALRQRDDEKSSLQGRHRGLRTSIRGAHSELSLSVVGLEAPASDVDLALREECQDFVGRMRKPEFAAALGEPDADQQPLDLERLATGMETALGRFKVALDGLTEAKKHRDATLVDRREAEARLRSTYANVARVQEGYYRLAGLEDLADRIRLTIPRSSRTEETPAPDAGEPAEEPGSPPSQPDETP